MQPDLTYSIRGLFVDFMPETSAGEDAWRVMAGQDPNCTFFAIHLDAIKAQLRAAGYTVAKRRKTKEKHSLADDEALLRELGV